MTAVKPRGAWGGSARFSGVVAVAPVPSALVASLLPAPLRARKQRSVDATHPLLFLVGELRDGGAHVAGGEFSLGIRYREAAIWVPDVSYPAADSPSLFSLAMFADDPRPILLGNGVYGFRKRRAAIEWSGASYRVELDDAPCLAVRGELHDDWQRARPELAPVRWLSRLASMPVLGRRATGDYVRSQFAWDLTSASIRRAGVEIAWRPEPSVPSSELRTATREAVAVSDMSWHTSPPTLP
jgi:hypothetical protein